MFYDAGEFNQWVAGFIDTMKGRNNGDVPCGDCVGCCTSSKFVLVRPTDVKAKKAIPEELLFSAPNLPKGFKLMGYDEKGHCPMFKQGKCTIYEARPETCRQYDCRVLAATGAHGDESPTIEERISAWQFSYDENGSTNKARAVQEAFRFLKTYAAVFPENYVPYADAQIAAMAVRVHTEFLQPVSDKTNIEALSKRIVESYPVTG